MKKTYEDFSRPNSTSTRSFKSHSGFVVDNVEEAMANIRTIVTALSNWTRLLPRDIKSISEKMSVSAS